MTDTRESLVVPNVYGLVRQRDAAPAVLIQKRWKPRSDPGNLGRWELPGGKWHAWEPVMDCLRREVEEETGVGDITVGQSVAEHELHGQLVQVSRPDLCVQMIDGGYPSMLMVFLAIGTGEPQSRGDDTRDAQWMPTDKLRQRLEHDAEAFTPLTYAGLREAFARALI
ncbi:NUDIX hydrolase [Actinopolymorpha sp. B17G11]|uniref:NUDIX hydrolase n=1 Tax=Actinopolymorpha sp. B17G11 TaxID=3160861 RepID=UPI0032E4C0E0